MPRLARLDAPGLLQHVIVRGINRSEIFSDDDDRRQFVARLSKLLVETGTDCFAWALIPNHAHLLLRCQGIELARFMRRLLTGYAVVFNRRHGRVGHLFQNRYKSIVCDEESYFLELIRYIHLNPLRAELVGSLFELERYPWCGHAVVLGHQSLGGQVVDVVLEHFSEKPDVARQVYRQFLSDGVAMGQRPELTRGAACPEHEGLPGGGALVNPDHRILGGHDFANTLSKQVDIWRPPPMTLDVLLAKVADHFHLPRVDTLRRGRRNAHAQARELFCFLAVNKLHYSGAKVGALLNMGAPSVSRAVRRGEVVVASWPEFGAWWRTQIKQ